MATRHRVQIFLARQPASGTGAGTYVELDVVESYAITLDVLSPGNAVTFTLWRSADRRSVWSTLIGDLARCGAPFLVKVDGVTMLTGFIEEVKEIAGRGGATIVLTGRDEAAKALDWDADPSISFRQLTIEDAYRRLYGSLGLNVVFAHDASVKLALVTPVPQGGSGRHSRRASHLSTIDRGRARVGEKVWSVGESFATHVGLWQWVAPLEGHDSMAIVLGVPDYKAAPFYTFERRVELFSGEATGNILQGEHVVSTRAVPTRVKVLAHGQRGDALASHLAAEYPLANENAVLYDETITGGRVYRPHPAQPRFVQSARARTRERTEQEANRLYAKAMKGVRTYRASVQGHSQEHNGVTRLYAPNTTATITDEILRVDGKWYLHRVTLKGDRKGGATSDLGLIPVNAVQLTVGVREGEAAPVPTPPKRRTS